MIVDDDDDLRKYIEHILSEDFNTISVADESDALEMLKNGTPVDILICDVMMPKIGGIELCRILRKDINLCHISVILLSGNSDEEIKAKALQSGSNVYISKPVEPSYLILQINNLIENRQTLWDSFSKRPFIFLSGIVDKSLKDTFIKQFSDIVLKNMSNPELSVDGIAEEMHTSRSVLYQKVKELSGMTPNNFIKVMRLRKAAQLLMQENYKINEICWLVGFNTPSYFSKCFFEEFGVHPKDFSSYSTTTSKMPTEE